MFGGLFAATVIVGALATNYINNHPTRFKY